MAEIDQGINDVVSAHKMRCFTIKTNQQGAKFVDPGEGSFAGEAQFVDLAVEEAFASAFEALASAGILDDVGYKFVVETRPAGGLGVKGSIGIEVAARDDKSQSFDELES